MYFRKVNPKSFFIGTNFILWILSVSFLMVVFETVQHLGINVKFFCFLNQGFSAFVSELNLLPVMAIWCSLSPDNLEATSITIFTGLVNTSYNLSNYFGSFTLKILKIGENNIKEIWLPLVI